LIDVELMEKGEVIRVGPCRMLLDVVVIQGLAKTVQRARDGSLETKELIIGDRI